MYFWACWFTKRYRLAIYLALGIALTVLATLPMGMTYRSGHWAFLQMTPEQIAVTWKSGIENTTVVLLLALIFAAADLGALALGDDSKRRDLDFLLTRPKPRRYFVWTSWLAGLSQLVPLLLLPALTSVFVLSAMTHSLLPGPLMSRTAETFILALVIYGVVFLLAALAQEAQSGFLIAALLVVLFTCFSYVQFVHEFFEPGHPVYRGQVISLEISHRIFPIAHLALISCAGLVLPLIAQFGFERRDL